MHRRNNPVAMFKPQPLENVILPNVHTWIRRRLKKFSCWIFPSLRAKREKKIKAMERDVIFFLPPSPGFLRGLQWGRSTKIERKKERKGERDVYEKTTLRFFHLPRGIHYDGSTTTTITILSHFFPPIISSPSFLYTIYYSSTSFHGF